MINIGQIQMDYKKANNQAAKLRDVAKNMKKAANKDFQDCIAEIGGNWTGESATAYIQKCNELKTKIIKSAAALEDAAKTIETIARRTYLAEMAAADIVNTVSH